MVKETLEQVSNKKTTNHESGIVEAMGRNYKLIARTPSANRHEDCFEQGRIMGFKLKNNTRWNPGFKND